MFAPCRLNKTRNQLKHSIQYKPHHEKTCFSICEDKEADQLSSYRAADQYLSFRYTDSAIPLLSKSLILNL